MDNQAENVVCSLLDLWPILCLVAGVALIVGFLIGALVFKKKTSGSSMEKFIMVLSGMFMVVAVIFQSIGVMEPFASVVTTIFTSVVFSWLLTKVSGKAEWQEREQELALRSYRHIDYIESASKTAEQTIKQYISGEKPTEISEAQKLVLSNAMDYIGYIRGGIKTCKMDWYDLMSQEGQSKFSSGEVANQVVNVSDLDISQEDV